MHLNMFINRNPDNIFNPVLENEWWVGLPENILRKKQMGPWDFLSSQSLSSQRGALWAPPWGLRCLRLVTVTWGCLGAQSHGSTGAAERPHNTSLQRRMAPTQGFPVLFRCLCPTELAAAQQMNLQFLTQAESSRCTWWLFTCPILVQERLSYYVC